MARAIALLGEGANANLAAELAGLDEPAAEEAIEALSRSDVLTRDRDRLGFVHPIVLAAIYNDLPVRARSEGHGRAARLLQARGATPEEIASQLALAAPRGEEWAVETLRTAASRALSLGDPLAAAAHLRRALAEPPADLATVYSELASAEGRAGVPGAAEQLPRGDAAGRRPARACPCRARPRPLPEARRRFARGDRRPEERLDRAGGRGRRPRRGAPHRGHLLGVHLARRAAARRR